MKKLFKFCLSLFLALGFAFSLIGCRLLESSDSTSVNDPENVDATAPYDGNKVNQTQYNGITYLEEEFDYTALYEENYRAVVTVSVTNSVKSNKVPFVNAQAKEIGSGFIISDTGYVLTSLSLFGNSFEEIEGILYNGESSSLEFLAYSINCDIALLQFSDTALEMPDFVEFSNANDLEYGEYCAYIANISDDEDYFVALSEGVVSKPKNTDSDFSSYIDGYQGYESKITADYLVQTSITTNEGNEGAPLFDSDGKCAGIVTTKAQDTLTFRENYGYGMSFCIPSTAIYEFIESCVNDSSPNHDFSDLDINFPESTVQYNNYIANPDEVVSDKTDFFLRNFMSSSDTKVADATAVVDLIYQGQVDKQGGTVNYISNNFMNFTVNVLSANETGQHASSGSGFIISEDGYVITNLHVINAAADDEKENANEIVKLYPYVYCTFENGTYNGKKLAFEMKVVAYDKIQDMAVLKFVNEFRHYDMDKNLQVGFEKVCKLADYGALRLGEVVVAVGNALGYGASVTNGVVSMVSMAGYVDIYGHTFIQTDCPINSGNSGGPLFNSEGDVVGINSMGLPAYENISWAIPSDCIKEFIDLIQKNKSSRSVIIKDSILAASATYQI